MHCTVYGRACLAVMGPLYFRCVGRFLCQSVPPWVPPPFNAVAAVLAFYGISRLRG